MIKEIFEDRYNFFNIGTIISIFILMSTVLLDYFTTMRLIVKGGFESNQLISPFVHDPFVAGLIKLTEIIVIVGMAKLIYDTAQNKIYTKYNNIIIYIMLSVPAGITLALAINNWVII